MSVEGNILGSAACGLFGSTQRKKYLCSYEPPVGQEEVEAYATMSGFIHPGEGGAFSVSFFWVLGVCWLLVGFGVFFYAITLFLFTMCPFYACLEHHERY